MGRTAKVAKLMEELSNQFSPRELCEGEVQAIFNRCLAKEDSRETTGSCLFNRALGYEKEDTGISFEKAQIAANHKSILYLFGQLRSVHTQESVLKTKMFSENYQGGVWTEEKASILQLLYLGSSEDFRILNPFVAKWDGTTLLVPVKPTLSPKDPAFPAWWEAHKAEWEQ